RVLPHRQPREADRRVVIVWRLLIDAGRAVLSGTEQEGRVERRDNRHQRKGVIMLKGFKDFILRGNVIDLAVAVVIGSAFTAIVTGLVTGIFNPVISMLFNASTLSKAGVTLRAASGGQDAVVLSWGLVIAAVIQFLLVAIVVYFALIVPMNYLKKLQAKRAGVQEQAPAGPTDTQLLIEIRDLLAAQAKKP
ncbi:MAG: large conductance mechanosensitive channel protein MscL, partial [Leifsonia sp.]